ncbi:MAG: hypothetical protein JWR42_1793, partial [Marmoricola sp.]|nr:hypothetical protein [Marmoricola sp.]
AAGRLRRAPGWFNDPMSLPTGPSRPSGPATTDRPRQLTMAGWFVVAGSVLVVLSSFTGLSQLYSLDNQERLQRVLSEGAGPGLGISVDQALTVMRVGLLLSGAMGAAAAVAGFFVLRRHRGARLLLAVLALPLLVTTLVSGGLTGALVVAATATMWSGPARDWFAGRPVRQPGARPPAARRPDPHLPGQQHPTQYPTQPPVQPSAQDPDQAPSQAATSPGQRGPVDPPTLSDQTRATQGFGQQRTIADPAFPSRQAYPGPQHPSQGAGVREAVPAGVRLACLATWVFAGLAALAHVAFMVFLVANPSAPVDYLVAQPSWQQFSVPRETVLPAMWVYAVGMVGWCLAACVLAFFTWRRHDWARWLLATSASLAFLIALTAFPIGMLHQLACALTVGGLFNATSREWFARQPPRGRPPRP